MYLRGVEALFMVCTLDSGSSIHCSCPGILRQDNSLSYFLSSCRSIKIIGHNDFTTGSNPAIGNRVSHPRRAWESWMKWTRVFNNLTHFKSEISLVQTQTFTPSHFNFSFPKQAFLQRQQRQYQSIIDLQDILQSPNILLINWEWGHYREISDRGLDVLTER